MAIIAKDGFDFIDDLNGNPEAFIVKGENLNEEIKYINENKLKSIYLTFSKSKQINDLIFLNEINHVEKVNFNDIEIDYSGLYNLTNLKYAILSIKNNTQYLDYSKFQYLEYLSIDWYTEFPDLSFNKSIKDLVIWKFKPKTRSFSEIKLPAQLESLEVTESNILSLEGLELKKIKKFEGHYCNSLLSVEGLKESSKNLRILILNYCKKLTDYNDLGNCKKLEKLILGDCGNIPTLSFLKEMKNIEHFSFWNTRLIDGDLNPCLGIDYVSFKDAKHYNHKMKDFENPV